MTDLEDGTATEQPADDIRSSLTAALAESEGAADVVAPSGDKTAATDGEVALAASERVRGADGKFVKKDETAPAEAKVIPDKAAAPVDPAASPVVDSKEAPTHWA